MTCHKRLWEASVEWKKKSASTQKIRNKIKHRKYNGFMWKNKYLLWNKKS